MDNISKSILLILYNGTQVKGHKYSSKGNFWKFFTNKLFIGYLSRIDNFFL